MNIGVDVGYFENVNYNWTSKDLFVLKESYTPEGIRVMVVEGKMDQPLEIINNALVMTEEYFIEHYRGI